MLSIQSKNQLKLVFSLFLPDVLTGWTILPKPFLSTKDLDDETHQEILIPACSTTIILLTFNQRFGRQGQIPQLVQCKSINCKSKKYKFHHQNSKSHNLFNASPTTTIANPTTANLYMLYNYHSSSINRRFGRQGYRRRRGFMLSIQSKNQLKTHFYLVPF